MLEGLGSFVALLLAFGICVVRPGLLSLAILGFVAGCIVLEEISRPNEDGNRARETDD